MAIMFRANESMSGDDLHQLHKCILAALSREAEVLIVPSYIEYLGELPMFVTCDYCATIQKLSDECLHCGAPLLVRIENV